MARKMLMMELFTCVARSAWPAGHSPCLSCSSCVCTRAVRFCGVPACSRQRHAAAGRHLWRGDSCCWLLQCQPTNSCLLPASCMSCSKRKEYACYVPATHDTTCLLVSFATLKPNGPSVPVGPRTPCRQIRICTLQHTYIGSTNLVESSSSTMFSIYIPQQ